MKRKHIFLLITILFIATMAIANTFLKNDVHEWRNNGKCLDCHSKLNKDGKTKEGLAIPAPRSHTDQFRKYTHGRTNNFSYQRCSSCHFKNECESCHGVLPESHSRDFVQPSGSGMERHILLATINPSSCLTCHRSFVVQCVGCHTPEEVMPWENQAIHRNMQ